MRIILIFTILLSITGCAQQENTVSPMATYTGTPEQAKSRVLNLMTKAGYELEDESKNRQVYSKSFNNIQNAIYKTFINSSSSTPRYFITVVFVPEENNAVLVRAYSSMKTSGLFGQQTQDEIGNKEVAAVLARL